MRITIIIITIRTIMVIKIDLKGHVGLFSVLVMKRLFRISMT